MSQHNQYFRVPDGWDDDEGPTEFEEPAPPAASAPCLAAAACAAASTLSLDPAPTPPRAEPAEPAPVAFPHAAKLSHFPAFVARSALFRVGRGKVGAERDLSGRVASHPQYRIEREGPRLGTWDKSVWEAAMAAGKRHGSLGEEMRISLSSVVAAIGSSDYSKASLAKVFESLSMLARTHVDFKFANTGLGGAGKLLASARREGGECRVALDPAFAEPAFSLNLQFQMLPARRRAISSDIGRWLHDFLSINEDYPQGFALGDLRRMCGYESDPGRFPSLVNAALAEIQSLPENSGRGDRGSVVESFAIHKCSGGADEWRLGFKRGTEKLVYEMHRADWASRSGAKQPSREAPRANSRGGVAL